MSRKKINMAELSPEPATEPIESHKVSPDSPEWSEFVLSHLNEDELFKGIPKIDGLRRMVELLVSKIASIDVEIIPVLGTYLTVCAKAKVELANGDIWTACSDACAVSVDYAFRNRLTSIADNRAKSKAFREILRLKNVLSVEEVKSDSTDLDDQEGIVASQRIVIYNKCKALKINIDKAVKLFYNVSNIDVLKHSQASDMIQRLSSYEKTKTIPGEITDESNVHN